MHGLKLDTKVQSSNETCSIVMHQLSFNFIKRSTSSTIDGLPQIKGTPLVQSGGLNVQNPTKSATGLTFCLLCDKCHGVALTQESQFTFGISITLGVQINSSFNHIAMKIGDQWANIMWCIWTTAFLLLTVFDVVFNAFGKMAVIPFRVFAVKLCSKNKSVLSIFEGK